VPSIVALAQGCGHWPQLQPDTPRKADALRELISQRVPKHFVGELLRLDLVGASLDGILEGADLGFS
jgi:hypothetical protein